MTDPNVTSGGEESPDETDNCYWCGGSPADGGSIRIQINEGEPERETCPDCFRDWPPEGADFE